MIICQGKLRLSCLSKLRNTSKPTQSKVALNILHIFIETVRFEKMICSIFKRLRNRLIVYHLINIMQAFGEILVCRKLNVCFRAKTQLRSHNWNE